MTAASMALLAAITAIAAVWAHLGGSTWAVTVACMLLVLDAWLGGRRLGPGWPALAAPAVALLLSLAPIASRRLPFAGRHAGWVGFAVFPLALADAGSPSAHRRFPWPDCWRCSAWCTWSPHRGHPHGRAPPARQPSCWGRI